MSGQVLTLHLAMARLQMIAGTSKHDKWGRMGL